MLTATGDASPVPKIFFCIDVCSRYAVWRFITLIIVFYIARSCTTTYENTSRLPYVSRGAVRRSAAHAPTRMARGTDGVLRDSGACSLGRGRRARLSLVQHAAVRACVQLREPPRQQQHRYQISTIRDIYFIYSLYTWGQAHGRHGGTAPRRHLVCGPRARAGGPRPDLYVQRLGYGTHSPNRYPTGGRHEVTSRLTTSRTHVRCLAQTVESDHGARGPILHHTFIMTTVAGKYRG
jgi:hypothetical protein